MYNSCDVLINDVSELIKGASSLILTEKLREVKFVAFFNREREKKDINRKNEFPKFFKDTWIVKNPTPLQGSFLVMRFNFSAVRADPAKVEEDFNLYLKNVISSYVEYYREIIPEDIRKKVFSQPSGPEMLRVLLSHDFYQKTRKKFYILIDEYDNFSNAILSAYSHEEYVKLTHGGGFFKDFFKKLKAVAEETSSSLARLFITGVSPITLDDVTSGFNIGENLSLDKRFSTLFGFTEEEVEKLYEYYAGSGLLKITKNLFFEVATKWYNNYKFSEEVQEKIFNPDMIFYFLKRIIAEEKLPRDLIDENVRMDYTKMRDLITVEEKIRVFNGNFSILKEVVERGGVQGKVVKSFPLEELTVRENFLSHLYYLGLLTFYDEDYLAIPNETVNQLLFGQIRSAYRMWGYSGQIYTSL